MKIEKLIGSVSWADYGVADDGEIHRAILRENDELVLDIETGGYRYSGVLKKIGASRYEGRWTCVDGRKTYVDDVTCRLYPAEGGYFLFGRWREAGVNHYWWSELSTLDRFPDEAG